ncbi:glycosyltransferase family 4 protein [Hydrogenobaculum acidophilum]
MKILSVLDAVGWGGTKEQAYITAMGLKNLGFDVSFALSYDFQAFKEKIKDKIPYYEFEKETPFKRVSLFNYKRLYDIILTNKFNVVFANSPKALDYIRVIYPFLSKKPKIVAFKRSGRKSSLLSKHLKYSIADKIVVVSKKVYQELLEENFFTDRLRLIQSGIDLSRFRKASQDEKISLRKKYNLPLDKHIFVNVANYNPEVKGHIDILKAYKKIEKDNTMLLFVGLLTDTEATKDAEALGIKHFLGLGYREDVEYILRACDSFVLGSRLEGIAGALLQAMASGLICISTDVGGITEYMKDGVNGFLTKPKDIDAMARAMEKVLNLDNQTKEHIIKNAIETSKGYSIEHMLSKYVKLLEELA